MSSSTHLAAQSAASMRRCGFGTSSRKQEAMSTRSTWGGASRIRKQYGLAPSGGPYLLLTTGHPDKTTTADGTMQLGLASKTPAEIAQILEKLTDDLVLNGTSSKEPDREGFWHDLQRSFERLQTAVGSVASGLTFGITTPFFSVSLKH